MIKLGRWQHIERMTGNSKLFAANPLDHIIDEFAANPLDHILDDFEWFPYNKPKFFRHKTMRQLRFTRAGRVARLNRNLRLREME